MSASEIEATCPKCGWAEAEYDYRYIMERSRVSFGEPVGIVVCEYILKTCKRCRFSWRVKPLTSSVGTEGCE